MLIAIIVLALTPIHAANAATGSAKNSTCTSSVKKILTFTIKSQNKALAKQDYKTAMAYSTAKFRAQVSLAEFTTIITLRYSFLGSVASFTIKDCLVIGDSIHSGVLITDTANTSHYLIYILQSQSKREVIAPNKTGYGIAAAQLGQVQPQAIY